ncbi:hypothetical protein AYI69_g9761 [Smittium culicis]|uniref:Endonuclease/exonuclease/phosphatase domain-containing protein n=1 Tax=Smittium culicis TaxID=133412 RepID=A0A1R1XAI1_9FUNG|nr:hypothetical protein AYI69_g9761 [Smittium culicis]
MSTVKIGFWNCNGLSYFKWKYAMDLFENGVYDMLFLAETWFVGEDNHKKHPYYAFSSVIEASKRSNGRCNNGMMCLAKPYIKNQISNVETTSYTMNVSIFGHNIYAVYFPPSMNINSVSNFALNRGYSVLFGDINTFFGSRFGQKKHRPSNMVELFEDLVHMHGMVHVRPGLNLETPDHAFCKADLTATWEFYDSSEPVPSDHVLMVLKVNLAPAPIVDILSYDNHSEPVENIVEISEYFSPAAVRSAINDYPDS